MSAIRRRVARHLTLATGIAAHHGAILAALERLRLRRCNAVRRAAAHKVVPGSKARAAVVRRRVLGLEPAVSAVVAILVVVTLVVAMLVVATQVVATQVVGIRAEGIPAVAVVAAMVGVTAEATAVSPDVYEFPSGPVEITVLTQRDP
jgi:hypothetical protein